MLLTFPVTDQALYLIEESTGVLWFKAADVCAILGFSNPTAAIGNHCPDDSKMIDYHSGRGRAALFVSEPGMYLLVMESKSKLARDFKEWIARDVLVPLRQGKSFNGVPNSESAGSEFWNLIDGALARNLEPERAITLHHQFTGKPAPEPQPQPKPASVRSSGDSSAKQSLPDWCDRIGETTGSTIPQILDELGVEPTKANQMLCANALRAMGRRRTRRRIQGVPQRIWS